MNGSISGDETDGAAVQYGPEYYAHSCGVPYHRDNPHWGSFFGQVADAIAAELQPRRVLDVGCAMGFLVEALRDRGVEAWGFDISRYALEQVRADIRPFCWRQSATDDFDGTYDLITCIEVLEHVPAADAPDVIGRLTAHTETVLFSSTPSDYAERTHVNVQPPDYWAGLFARASFYRDVDLEASFVAPHAVVFRRKRGSMVPIVRGYERRYWQLATEVRALRAAQRASGADGHHPNPLPEEERVRTGSPQPGPLAQGEGVTQDGIPIDRQDPAWRLFIALTGARRRLTPDATLRGRIVRLGLKSLADGLDWAYTHVAALRANPPAVQLDGTAPQAGGEVQIGIDGPLPNPLCRRLALVSGWAIDPASPSGPGISAVRVHLDGAFKGTAAYGLPRYDLEETFGARFYRGGWRFALDVHGVAPGAHLLEVTALSELSGQAATHPTTVTVAPATPAGRRKLVLFLSGCPGDTLRYRCDHAAEQVRSMGGSADVAVHGDVDLGEALERYHGFVLHRVKLSEDIAWLLAQAQARKLPVFYDIDDLMFEARAAPEIAAVEQLTRRDQRIFLDGLTAIRDALLRTDVVLVSSEPLRLLVDELVGEKRARLAPNVVSQDMLHQADAVLQRAGARAAGAAKPTVTIAYLSGTRSHDRDFLSAAEGLIWALDEFPHARLVTVGPVGLDLRFRRFGDRVEQRPLRPWQELAGVLAAVDINIAPLEPDNRFTEAKSCIKYLEAGLVGVPTIASPRADFSRVMSHGVNGFLAETPDEWRTALRLLIDSGELRRHVGQRAREDVLRNHTTAAAARSYYAALAEIVALAEMEKPVILSAVKDPRLLRGRTDPSLRSG